MAITQKSIKLLWSGAAGHCSFSDCWERLSFGEASDFTPHTIGHMAHICGDKPESRRHNPDQTGKDRDNYSNLILLCPTHHTLIDEPENEARFTVEVLLAMKRKHEEETQEKLETPKSIETVCQTILPVLADNHQAWVQYGPFSEIAHKNPHSEAAYAMWLSERLTTIVPNNRRIAALISDGRSLFPAADQAVIAEFLGHVQSYEAWVHADTNYEAVTRFPTAFEEMIKGYLDAS